MVTKKRTIAKDIQPGPADCGIRVMSLLTDVVSWRLESMYATQCREEDRFERSMIVETAVNLRGYLEFDSINCTQPVQFYEWWCHVSPTQHMADRPNSRIDDILKTRILVVKKARYRGIVIVRPTEHHQWHDRWLISSWLQALTNPFAYIHVISPSGHGAVRTIDKTCSWLPTANHIVYLNPSYVFFTDFINNVTTEDARINY